MKHFKEVATFEKILFTIFALCFYLLAVIGGCYFLSYFLIPDNPEVGVKARMFLALMLVGLIYGVISIWDFCCHAFKSYKGSTHETNN